MSGGDPAFPETHEIEHLSETCSIPKVSGGLTKREFFAESAGKSTSYGSFPEELAVKSIRCADALLEQFEKEEA